MFDSAVGQWAMVGLSAASFILVLKLIFLKFQIPGLTPAVASI